MLTPERVEGLYDYIGARIRSERAGTGLSQGELGRRVGLTRTSISNIELGRQKIQIHTLYDIATVLGVPPAALLPPQPDRSAVEERYLRRLSLGEGEWVRGILAPMPGGEVAAPNSEKPRAIEKDSEALLRRLGVNVPPVPVDQVASRCGAEIRYAAYDGEMGGLLLNEGGRVVIGLNSVETKARQRFAIAHLLGHLALHGEKGLRVDRTFSSMKGEGVSAKRDQEESAANDFAAGLLVPPSMIKADLKGKKVDYSNGDMLAGLADRYKVGVEVMVYRLMRMDAITAS